MYRIDSLYRQILDNLNDGIRFVDRDFRITYWNKGAEIITGFREEDVKGTCCGGNFKLHYADDGENICEVNRCPIRLTMTDGKTREENLFFRHRDGHLVPVILCVTPILGQSDEITGAVEIFQDNSWSLAALKRIEELNEMSMLDPLTQVGNRRYLERAINARLEEMRRHGSSFGLVFIDIDDFKTINDTHGHKAGDRLLKAVARTVAGSLRVFDTIARWAGDEFIVVGGKIQQQDQMQLMASRLRALVEQTIIRSNKQDVRTTVSIGGTVARPGDTVESIIERADSFMYLSKTAGKNREMIG